MTEKLSMDDALVQKLKEILEANLSNENFGVSELATEAGISRSQLHRRLKDSIGKSSSQFIREYRLERAMEMLKQNSGTASEISYKVGFSSPTYFSTTFKNFYGYSPGEVKFQTAIAPPKKTFSKKLVGVIPIIILIGLIVFNEVYKNNFDPSEIEKTIAVLPFANESDNEENLYFCNGIMAGIRNNLAKIPEFSVVSRRSAEGYRNSSATLKSIASELNVNYVVEGHVQRIGDRAIISTELIQVHDNKILWSERYDQSISEVFRVQADVIEAITDKLEAIITPNLRAQLDTRPTKDTLAYQYYLKGQELRYKASRYRQKKSVWSDFVNKAELSYELAIESDSSFAQPYLGLAHIVLDKKSFYGFLDKTYSDEDFMNLIDRTIQLDPNLIDAYALKGYYYYHILNRSDDAKVYLEKATDQDPNNWEALSLLSRIYRAELNYAEAISINKKREKLARTDKEKYLVYYNYSTYYFLLEDYDKVHFFYDKMFEIDSSFLHTKSWAYTVSKEYDKAISYIKKKCPENSPMRSALIGENYFQMKNYTEALKYFNEWDQLVSNEELIHDYSFIHYASYGFTLINKGQTEKGMLMLKKQVELFEKVFNAKQKTNPVFYLISASCYMYLGNREKAYESIDIFEEINGWVSSGYSIVARSSDIFRDDPYLNASLERGEEQLKAVQNQIRPYLPEIPVDNMD